MSKTGEETKRYDVTNILDDPYCRFPKEELILRDHLAIDRTVLANERTLLAYVRTALAIFVAGVSFIQFFDSILMAVLGWIFVPIGVFIFVVGFLRYKKMANRIQKIGGSLSDQDIGNP